MARYHTYLVQALPGAGPLRIPHGEFDSYTEAVYNAGLTYSAWKRSGDHTMLTYGVTTGMPGLCGGCAGPLPAGSHVGAGGTLFCAACGDPYNPLHEPVQEG